MSWFIHTSNHASAALRCVCFAGAGQGASIFNEWRDIFSEKIDVWAVQLPGRENRFTEAVQTAFRPLSEELVVQCARLFDRPIVLFGYSMGALHAYEVAAHLAELGAIWLRHLIVAGCAAPPLVPIISATAPDPSTFSDSALAAHLACICSQSQAALADKELLELFLPIARGDYLSVASYRWDAHSPLNVPITACCGTRDYVTAEQIAAWNDLTTATFRLLKYDGDHSLPTSVVPFMINELACALEDPSSGV
jgi:medium-chain acyl-[acyl-carrier-protein] hydrolase